ncbi:MAG: mechanosensitive ion channel [Desulfuromonadia bacterium]
MTDILGPILQLATHQEGDSSLLFWLREILVATLIFFLFWVASRVVGWFLRVWGPRITSFTKSELDDRILTRITPPITFLVAATGLYVGVRSLPLPDRLHLVASGAIFILVVITLANVAWRSLDEVIGWYGSRIADRDSSGGLDRQLLPLMEKLATLFIIATALIITLKHFNYDILSLVTALGIGSLAIGMAAKDTLAHLISGFTIMLDRPFRLGDRIQLSDGKMGDVVTIGLRSTKIRTLDNMLLIIPNSDLCNTTVVNFAFPDFRAKGKVSVGVGYGSDIQRVKELLVEIALAEGEVLPDPRPESFFVSFGDSALNLTLFFWVADYSRLFAVTDRINTAILSRFREEGIVIPYPIRTIITAQDA